MKALWKKWSEEGLRFPYLYDPVSKKPSITIIFPYISFVILVISIICLHIWPAQLLVGTTFSMMFWIISIIFYQIRKLSKVKFDLDDKSFELESEDDQ